jgi:hypothetical protein
MEPILTGFQKALARFGTKCFYCFGQQSGQRMGILPEDQPAKMY